MSFLNQIVAGLKLVRAAIQSPNYATGVSGWTINRDGSAEFNNIVIRGGTQTQGAILLYNGTPALGNLIGSVAPAAGTDSFGNTYGQGFNVYGDPLGNSVTTSLNGGQVSVTTPGGYSMTLTDTGLTMDDGNYVMRLNPNQLRWRATSDNPATVDYGGVYWDWNDGTKTQRYLRLASGDKATGRDPAFIWLFGEDTTGTRPLVRIDNSGAGTCDLSVHGNTDVQGILTSGNQVVGHVSITPSAANTPTSSTVTYPTLSGTTFRGLCTANTTVPGTTVTGVAMTSVGASSAIVWVTRTNTTATGIDWHVIGV